MKTPVNTSILGAVVPAAAMAASRRGDAAGIPRTGAPVAAGQGTRSVPQSAPEIIATGIRVRPNRLFAASSVEAGGPSGAGNLPPGSAGGAGSGNGLKADPAELGDALAALLEEGVPENLLQRRIQADLKSLGSNDERLFYLAFAGSLLNSPAVLQHFDPEATIRLAHGMSRKAEILTPYVTPEGVLVKPGIDLYNLMHAFFTAAHAQEELLLQQGSLNAETASHVADIRFAFTRRGLLYYAHMTRGDECHCRPSRIALMLLDLDYRYQSICMGKRSLEARTVLRELREPLGIPWQEEAWAVADLQGELRRNIELIGQEIAAPARLQLMLRAHDTGLNACMRGIYSYSHRFFADSALGLRKLAIALPPSSSARNLLLEQALAHEQRGTRELLMASRLGLHPLPEEV